MAGALVPPLVHYRAAWVLTIVGPPIRQGWVTVDATGRVRGVGADAPVDPAPRVDLGSAAVLPGLSNTHTHLELSGLRGRVAPAASMPEWVQELILTRRAPDAAPPDAIEAAVAEARACGTALVGDVGNTLASLEPLGRSGIAGVVFKELLGFDVSPVAAAAMVREEAVEAARLGSPRLRVALAAHAPYSVSPGLLRELGAAMRRGGAGPYGVHLAESADEVEFLASGTGRWRTLLDALGVWSPEWQVPACRPVEYLDRLGFLGPGLLAAHGVQLTPAELERLAHADVTLVACPRSNAWTGAGEPPVRSFYESGVRIAIGTDSLASCPDLNVFGELLAMRRLAPEVPASRLLHSATLEGARALGFEQEFGSIEPGKQAALLAVDVPRDLADVEEYLVGGIEPNRIRWIEPMRA